jgi:hypothetical protein
MRGGVTLSSSYRGSIKEALYFFIANSTFNIIADEGIASYVYACHLKDHVESPYVAMRSDNFNSPVRSILLKIMFHTNYDDDYISDIRIHRYGEREDKEKTSSGTLIEEVEIQQQVYQASFKDELTPCEPICPAIITYLTNIEVEEKETLFNFIISNLITRKDDPKMVNSDEIITKEIFKGDLSLIAMELMEGYRTVEDILEKGEKEYNTPIILMWAWNLARLKNVFGIAHRDLHESNLLFNMNKRFYGDSNKLFYGQMIIIDFGRVTVRNKKSKPMPTNLSTWRMAIYNSRFNLIGKWSTDGLSSAVFRSQAIEFNKFNQHAVDKLNKMTELRKEVANKFLTDFQVNYGISFQEACSMVSRKSLRRRSSSTKSMSAGAGSGAGAISDTDVSKREMLRLLQGEINVNVQKVSSLTPRAIVRRSITGRIKKKKSRSGTRKHNM